MSYVRSSLRQASLDRQSAARIAGKRALSPRVVQGEPPPKKNAGKDGDKENEDAPKVENDFVAWLQHQNASLEELLSKSVKLGRTTTTKQQQSKIAELASVIKEFRAAAKYLLEEKTRLASELETARATTREIETEKATEKTQLAKRICELETQVVVPFVRNPALTAVWIKIGHVEEKLREAQSYVVSLQTYNASLQKDMTNTSKRLTETEVIFATSHRLKSVLSAG